MLLAMDRVAFLFLCFIMTFLSLNIVCYSLPFKVRYQRRSVVSSNHRLYSDGDKFEKLMLGAPYSRPLDSKGSYYAKPFRGDQRVMVDYEVASVDDLEGTMDHLIHQIDDHKGVLLTSSYEFPGRYSRWTVGFTAPAIQIEGTGLNFTITALNERGQVLSSFIRSRLEGDHDLFALDDVITHHSNDGDNSIIGVSSFCGHVVRSLDGQYFTEEDRSKQPSLFSLVRAVRDVFEGGEAGQLGLYGAFGYDLTFQFEPVAPKKTRSSDQRDLVMYLPDQIVVIDNQRDDAWTVSYDFTSSSPTSTAHELTTVGLPRTASVSKYESNTSGEKLEKRDTDKGNYAESVLRAKQEFKVGNLFEVVLSQTFREAMTVPPSTVFRRLCRRNPSPYGFFINLGRNEYLIGASPEMFVRVESTRRGLRIETCPISGTIERGSDALEDAQQIKKLLSSSKEESELTMCTDVDRNDKSRICIPGSVKVIGRRQIELYSRLIHTVDHVEGILRKGFDALDAFLCHTWAVTVTGAPKTWAIRFIEDMEPSVRHWYGGAVGIVGFDGSLNTGLTLRTVRVKNGIAEVRAGATLLHDSDPSAEEAETELKASALLDAIIRSDSSDLSVASSSSDTPDCELFEDSKANARVLLVDHEDSFVHTLANYLRQTGAEVVTCRSGPSLASFVRREIDSGAYRPDLVVLSPGPGSPSDFFLTDTINSMIERRIPIFGVCLGLQGLVEHFGGSLGVLDYPMHGKPSPIRRLFDDTGTHLSGTLDPADRDQFIIHSGAQVKFDILRDLPSEFQVARYHSLYGQKHSFPSVLVPTAITLDGVVMALQHRSLPIAAVQFHPESILTLPKYGMKIISNALRELKSDHYDLSVGSDSLTSQPIRIV